MKHRCTTHSGIVHPTKGDEYILLKNERMKLLIPYTILESLFTIQGRPIYNKFIHCTALSGWHSICTESFPSVMVGWVASLVCVANYIHVMDI